MHRDQGRGPQGDLGITEVVYGSSPSARPSPSWPAGRGHRPNRNTVNVFEGQQLMAGGKFDPGAAVREINRELQTAKRSRPSAPNWNEITRAICGPYMFLPVDTPHIDAGLDLAKTITEKNQVALRNPCD